MGYNVLIDEAALEDVSEAYCYYSKISENIANEFYTSWIQALTVLASNPHFRIRYKSIRCLPLLKFPYMIHFEVKDSIREVNVLALIHTHRDPEINYLQESPTQYMPAQ